jgi:uncharacterized protein YycO
MRKSWVKKAVVIQIILLYVGINTVPNISGNTGKIRLISSATQNNEKSLTTDIKVPDCVEVGDLLFVDFKEDESNIWRTPGPYNDHCAIYIGNNTFVDAAGPGVHANNYFRFYYWTKNLVFLRVKTANDSQRQAAVDWAISKIGTPYQVSFDFPWFMLKIADTNFPFPTAKEFYCTELLWAAYYNQGIDIDQNGWKFPWWVTGNDILNDDDVEVIYKEIDNSTGITKPNKGVYVANKKITFTLNKTIIFGDIDIEVVTYNDMITRVDFFIDNAYKANDTAAPYTWTWQDRDPGKKVIKAVACDDDGNQYSTTITVWKFF